MEIIERRSVPEQMLPGRFMQKLVGKKEDGYLSDSRILNIGYCRYCAEAGPMEPHMHAEETVQVLASDRAWVRFGPDKDDLPHKVMLQPNMTLHIPAGEWHVFEYAEGGSLEILFIYGAQVQL
ncbi:MAG: hypothetical protein E7446_00380 [Ruminococcaceae bacterium]|nr:hypothetical protein [Oscillospiraceae bacterium]